MKIEKQEVETGNFGVSTGIWTIYKKGDTICIVDQHGRERHRSKGHLMTAVYLAMFMARDPLPLHENADAALRHSAKQFLEESEREEV